MADFKETIVGYLVEDDYISFTSQERKYANKYREYKIKYPNDVEIISDNQDGISVRLSKEKFSFRPPTPKKDMSDEQREKARERFIKYHQEKGEK